MAPNMAESGVKRKRKSAEGPSKKKKKARSESGDESGGDNDNQQSQILLLENGILESRKNYNNISTLLSIAKKYEEEEDVDTAVVAAVSLCRVFIRLLANGNLTTKKGASEKEQTVLRWLRERLSEYRTILVSMLQHDGAAMTALTLGMRLLKAEAEYAKGSEDYSFPGQSFAAILEGLLQPEVDEDVRDEFGEKFVGEYDDIRFYTFRTLREILSETSVSTLGEDVVSNVFDFLVAMDTVPGSNEELEDFYIESPKNKKHVLYSLSQHKKQAQEAWLALMRLGLNKAQKKKVLDIMSTSIAPWFTKPELLMDFLTDCYNTGGSMSLLALSGVFYLIQERNLDYPSFYAKLYSLLDADILHSKHRSRFFRLLDTFLASSHLPAVLVASFIKRLARLALNAPPAAIVAIVPWMYNILKKHPLCTFMIHRVPRSKEEKALIESEGMEDPFLPDELDPMETHAIDSCLWEIVQLQTHYHPNVATIAKIISEQFTKQYYNTEDFLDHSYQSVRANCEPTSHGACMLTCRTAFGGGTAQGGQEAASGGIHDPQEDIHLG
jgi:U3 small nucleolar RNA-associated protein 19